MTAPKVIIPLLCVAGVCIGLWFGNQVHAADIENCLMCHRHRFIGRIDENGKQWNYNVDEILYNNSVHRLVACRSCHTAIKRIPHDPLARSVNCAEKCHVKPPFAQQQFSHDKIIALFDQSVHRIRPQDSEKLKNSQPQCKYCHLNPLYTVISEERVPFEKTVRRCYNCHSAADVTQAYRHITHRLRKKTTRSPQQIVQLCSKCHANRSMMQDLNVSPKALEAVTAYNRSIHGKSVRLGSTQAADCLSCHSSSALHDIFKEDNTRASTNRVNLEQTCRQCHTSTNRWFVQIAVHPGMQPEENRIVAGLGTTLRILLYGSVSGLLVLLLFETIGRRKEGIRLLLWDGTTWRRKSIRKSDKHKGRSNFATGPDRLNQPLSAYIIGSIFIVLSIVITAGIFHHLTISSHGPGLLIPFWNKYAAQPKSDIMAKTRRMEEMEQHRHFHNVAADYPRWPKNLRPVCFICHSDFPHSKSKRTRGLMNIHTQFFVCETCHIKAEADSVIDYKWYSPLEPKPQGPFYGTSYDLETGSLSAGKNLLAKIAPFVKLETADNFRPAILPQDAPMAIDFMKVRNRLSTDQREAIKNKFHENVKPKGYDCKMCHSKNSILDFKQLGFADNRASILRSLSIVDMLSEYPEFYIPEFFSEPTNGDIEK